MMDELGALELDELGALLRSSLEVWDVLEGIGGIGRLGFGRLRGIGTLEVWDVGWHSASGGLIRGCGLNWDLRSTLGYELYGLLTWSAVSGALGDGIDRLLVRIVEVRQGIGIGIELLGDGLIAGGGGIWTLDAAGSIEGLIHMIGGFGGGLGNGIGLGVAETSKGEYGAIVELGTTGCGDMHEGKGKGKAQGNWKGLRDEFARRRIWRMDGWIGCAVDELDREMDCGGGWIGGPELVGRSIARGDWTVGWSILDPFEMQEPTPLLSIP
jgi:hypothetical protein